MHVHEGTAVALETGDIFACILVAVGALIGLAVLAFWVWMLIDAATKTPSENNTKLVWVLILVLVGPIGAVIYFFVQRPKNPPAGPPPGGQVP